MIVIVLIFVLQQLTAVSFCFVELVNALWVKGVYKQELIIMSESIRIQYLQRAYHNENILFKTINLKHLECSLAISIILSKQYKLNVKS